MRRTLECDWDPLKRDLHAAASSTSPRCASRRPVAGGRSLPAAGLPWFMTMFGRDSIITSLQALPFVPELAATTLRELASRQGTRSDDFRDEEPGRILHELRYGELTAFEERPHSPYYGTADATPLFVVLLDEYERWTGDTRLVARAGAGGAGGAGLDRRLRRPARQRLHLVPAPQRADRAGEPVLEGLLGLHRATATAAARLPARHLRAAGLRLRRAACAAPGWPAQVWKDAAYADQLERKAADLKRRFNRDFWLEDGEYFALALDHDGNAGRRADLEHRPPAVERHRGPVEGQGRRRAT